MPRNVRPSFVSVSLYDSTDRPTRHVAASGPKGRTGTLSAVFSVRDVGSVLPLLDVEMIGSTDGSTVLVRVTDKRTGCVVFTETFAQ